MMSRQGLLIIEDSKEDAFLLKVLFEDTCEVHWAADLKEARQALADQSVDAIILDINLPDGNGIAFWRELKTKSEYQDIAVFILTSQSDLNVKISGFELEIQDFIEKPYHPAEVKARVTSCLRRRDRERHKDGGAIRIGPFAVYPKKYRICSVHELEGKFIETDLKLTLSEYRVFKFLLEKHGEVVNRETLLELLWQGTKNVTERTIDNCIYRIRKQLGDHGTTIETISGVGYSISHFESDKHSA